MGIITTVLVTPTKVVFQTQDCTLTIIHRTRFALCPVTVTKRFLAEPIPLPGLGAASQADPHFLQAAIVVPGDFVIDVVLKLIVWEADHIQMVVFTVLY